MPGVAGKVVLITGAAQGIGRATAVELVRRGAKVIATDVDETGLARLADELGEAAVEVVADVTDLAEMQVAVNAGIDRFGGIDLVLANAGIASYGSVRHVDPAAFRKVIDINITGVFHTVRAALPALIARRGYILVVSSLAAFAPAPGLVAYNASKAGAEHFASALRLEVKQYGVDVGSAHMAWIRTPLVTDARSDMPAFADFMATLPGPFSKILPVEDCVAAFVDALERRKRRVYVPKSVRALAWGRNIVSSRLVERMTLRKAPELLARMDAESAGLGRSTSSRNLASGAVTESGEPT